MGNENEIKYDPDATIVANVKVITYGGCDGNEVDNGAPMGSGDTDANNEKQITPWYKINKSMIKCKLGMASVYIGIISYLGFNSVFLASIGLSPQQVLL